MIENYVLDFICQMNNFFSHILSALEFLNLGDLKLDLLINSFIYTAYMNMIIVFNLQPQPKIIENYVMDFICQIKLTAAHAYDQIL